MVEMFCLPKTIKKQQAASRFMHDCIAVQVRSSPAASKRSFLEKKGLTAAEIEEGFRRVPDIPTASVPAGPSGLPVQAAEPPPKPFPTGTAATLQQLQPQPIVQQQQAPTPQPIRWTQVRCTAAYASPDLKLKQTLHLLLTGQWFFTAGPLLCFKRRLAYRAWPMLDYVCAVSRLKEDIGVMMLHVVCPAAYTI